MQEYKVTIRDFINHKDYVIYTYGLNGLQAIRKAKEQIFIQTDLDYDDFYVSDIEEVIY